MALILAPGKVGQSRECLVPMQIEANGSRLLRVLGEMGQKVRQRDELNEGKQRDKDTQPDL